MKISTMTTVHSIVWAESEPAYFEESHPNTTLNYK